MEARRVRRVMPFAGVLAVAGLVVAVSIGLAGRSDSPSLVASAPADSPTFGSIPPSAMTGDGGINLDRVPDFVSVLSPDGEEIVGYMRKDDLFPSQEATQARLPASPEEVAEEGFVVVGVYDVYDSMGDRVVGHWVDGAGFVDLSVDVDAIVEQVKAETRANSTTTVAEGQPGG
jgi:hypothetical protein